MSTGKTYRLLALMAIGCASMKIHAQVPITPLWSHVDAFGAGSWYPDPDVLSTCLAFDHSTGKIHRAITQDPASGTYLVQVFDVNGNDLTPAQPITIQGISGNNDGMVTKVIGISAINDTIAAIVRYDVFGTTSGDMNWLKALLADGSHILLQGSGEATMMDTYKDQSGSLVLVDDELRSCGATNWPNGNSPISGAERMALFGNIVVLGLPPSITRIDRGTMTPLTPIAVPSTGTAITSVCLANTGSAFNYAAVNSNGTMDVGLADSNSGSISSTTMQIPSGAEPTAYHVDELGNFWIAFAHSTSGWADMGLLYRFYQSGGAYSVSTYSRRIDDIASSGNRLLLTGRVTGTQTSTYLAAFDIDLITGVPNDHATSLSISPNPANDLLYLHGTTTWSEGWITDATGKTVLSISQAELSSGSISIGDLAVGSYRLSVRNAKDIVQHPLIIAR